MGPSTSRAAVSGRGPPFPGLWLCPLFARCYERISGLERVQCPLEHKHLRSQRAVCSLWSQIPLMPSALTVDPASGRVRRPVSNRPRAPHQLRTPRPRGAELTDCLVPGLCQSSTPPFPRWKKHLVDVGSSRCRPHKQPHEPAVRGGGKRLPGADPAAEEPPVSEHQGTREAGRAFSDGKMNIDGTF